jgi:hypothetical protein
MLIKNLGTFAKPRRTASRPPLRSRLKLTTRRTITGVDSWILVSRSHVPMSAPRTHLCSLAHKKPRNVAKATTNSVQATALLISRLKFTTRGDSWILVSRSPMSAPLTNLCSLAHKKPRTHAFHLSSLPSPSAVGAPPASSLPPSSKFLSSGQCRQ